MQNLENFPEVEIQGFITENYTIEDLFEWYKVDPVKYLTKNSDISDVLFQYDNDDIAEYLSDEDYYVFEDEDSLFDACKDTFNQSFLDVNDSKVSTFRRSDCLEMIKGFVEANGWNELYERLNGIVN